jgi:UDP-glucose:(heptosyl)LPS alpha-1,3-glucosyltransferase
LPAEGAGDTAGLPGRRLRIAYVLHDYNRHGGQSRYVAELASRFKRGHEVHVFANTFEEPAPEGLTYHHVPAWRRNALTSILSFVPPATLMVARDFDIVHAQGLCGLRQNVVTAHICQPAWYGAMARNAGRPGWRKRLFHALVSRLERLAFRPGAARRFIAVSQRLRHDLEAHYGCRDRVRVIPHGVDTETFHPRNRAPWRPAVRRDVGLPESACAALYVGDMQKGMPAAVRAVARVPGVHLVAVSRSPADPYRALAQQEGIADRVHFRPPTAQVERYYAAADLFVFPTVYDSFGLVVTEAMASGLPVVASRAAGAAELIDHGTDGLVVDDPWDPAALAAAIGSLVGDAALRSRLGGAARQKAERYTWDETARRTMAVYQEVVAERGTRPMGEPGAAQA